MAELCCSVNPKDKCRGCSTPLCAEHVKRGRICRENLWCRECADTGEDYLNIIDDLSCRLEEAVIEFDAVADLVDDVHGHVSRCRNCRNDSQCMDIFGIIENMGSHTSSVRRRVSRLNR